MDKLRNFFYGIFTAVVLALVVQGSLTLWGFRNDYLKIRQEHQAVYGYLAGVVGKTPDGKPITRADLIELVLQKGLQQPKE